MALLGVETQCYYVSTAWGSNIILLVRSSEEAVKKQRKGSLGVA